MIRLEAAEIEIVELNATQFDVFYRLRMGLLKALGESNEAGDAAALEQASKEYFAANIGKNFLCWSVLVEGEPVSIACLCVFHRLPYGGNLCGKEGHLLNIYTAPAFRKRGMAKMLVETMIDYAANNGILRLWLKASAEGRSIYKECGFVEKPDEMELFPCPS